MAVLCAQFPAPRVCSSSDTCSRLQGEGFLVVGEVAKELSDVDLVGVQ